jgi:hypothetical protein
MTVRKPVQYVFIAALIVFVLMQFVQPERSNPTVDPAMTMQSQLNVPADIAALLDRGCKDCHTNQTAWPFYAYIAPASWLVSYDVTEGRKHLNMSEWGKYKEGKKAQKLSGIYQAVSEGSMPLPKYIPLHPEAKFTDSEKAALAAWAQKEGERLLGGGEESEENKEN